LDFFEGYSPEQLALIDQVRSQARRMAELEWTAEVSAESVRRLQALGSWRRFRVNAATRVWSTVAVLLFGLRKWVPSLRGAAVTAADRVLRPPALYPEWRTAASKLPSQENVDPAARRAAAYHAIADGVSTLGDGNLSVERTLQLEELARWAENGADEAAIREALSRIRGGEALVATLKRGLSAA